MHLPKRPGKVEQKAEVPKSEKELGKTFLLNIDSIILPARRSEVEPARKGLFTWRIYHSKIS